MKTDVRLRDDDRCWEVTELHEHVTGLGMRRIQRVYVMRDDELYSYEKDLGPAVRFTGQPSRFVSFGEDSVGAVLEMAERARHDGYWAGRLAEMQAATTLIPDFLRMKEQQYTVGKRLGMRNR